MADHWLALLATALFLFTRLASARIGACYPAIGQMVAIAGGRRLHVIEHAPIGPARGAIVLLHGASGNARDMSELGGRLAARGFRVLAPDRPGHGWSTRGRADSAPDRQAAMIRAGLEALGVSDCIVLAHSLSGAIALSLALDHADFCRGMVLESPVTHPWPGGIAAYYRFAATPVLGVLFTELVTLPAGLLMMPGAVRSVFAPDAPPPNFIARTALPLTLRPAAFRANARDVAGLYAFVVAIGPRLPAIALPVAIVSGDADRIVLTKIHSLGSARNIPGASLRLLPATGHAPHWTRPAEVVAAVLEVAERVGASEPVKSRRP